MQIISYQKIQFLSILDKYFKCYGNINAFWPLFGIGSYQLWPCHVTQAKNVSFPYLKSYCPLNFRKVTKFRVSAASLMEIIKMTIWRRVESAPPPSPQCGIGLSTPLNVTHFGLGLDLPLYRMFRSFQIISLFPGLKTRLQLNVLLDLNI